MELLSILLTNFFDFKLDIKSRMLLYSVSVTVIIAFPELSPTNSQFLHVFTTSKPYQLNSPLQETSNSTF